jgi:hypothetical protein
MVRQGRATHRRTVQLGEETHQRGKAADHGKLLRETQRCHQGRCAEQAQQQHRPSAQPVSQFSSHKVRGK